MIPERSGIGLRPHSAASNDQISRSPGNTCLFGSRCCCLARVCSSGESERDSRVGEGRPARYPTGYSKLLTTGLAQFQDVLPAHGRLRIDDSGSSFGDRAPLMANFSEAGMTIARNDTQIDHASSAAICEEIGDRLRLTLALKPHRLPRHMMNLVERMAADKPVILRLTPKTEVAR
jgi:hypothetical protein